MVDAQGAPTPSAVTAAGAALASAIERSDWQGEATVATRVRVENRFGEVRLRFGGYDRRIEVAAALQQLDPAGSRLELVVDASANPATVTVIRRPAPTATPAEPAAARPDRSRADIVVLVPQTLAASARTSHGLLECQGVRSDVELVTESGEIQVRSTQGRVTARTDRGPVRVTLLPHVTRAPQSFSSVTGDIEVWVPAAADFDVMLATSGSLTTDFSLQVEHRDHQEPDKIGLAQVGAGGQSLELRSQRGNLALRRLPPAENGAVKAP